MIPVCDTRGRRVVGGAAGGRGRGRRAEGGGGVLDFFPWRGPPGPTGVYLDTKLIVSLTHLPPIPQLVPFDLTSEGVR